MDTVILAAGRGSRLGELTPPFYKPMMVVDGRPLIVRAITQAIIANGSDDRIIIVAAPENAAPLSHYLGDQRMVGECRMTVQIGPTGPGDALLLGLELVQTDHTLILMADNVFGKGDIPDVVDAANTSKKNVIGVRDLPKVEHFTRRRRTKHGATWVEKVPEDAMDFDETGHSQCWVGPLALRTAEAETALRGLPRRGAERPIGPVFNELSDVGVVDVETYDIGTPEEWT